MTVSNAIKIDCEKNIITEIDDKCTRCCKCKKDCGFLQKYGTPGDIAGRYRNDRKTFEDTAFECSLCALCTAVCPEKIDPASMFLEIRRQAVTDGKGLFKKHLSILNYEKRGTSKKYSLYLLPNNCETVFFPGCALAGTRPSQTLKTLDYLKEIMPSMGVVLDCCTKPSHDLGRQDYFIKMFSRMTTYLKNKGVKNIIVACPNCYKVFSTYSSGLKTTSVYEVMEQYGFTSGSSPKGYCTIHDPCVIRFNKNIQRSVRNLAQKNGLTIVEPKHTGTKTFCCGEGGSVGCINPQLSSGWTEKRSLETARTSLLSYCAGCINFLGKKNKTFHLLDYLFEPEKTLAGKHKVSRSPLTYLNRLQLKRRLKKQFRRE